MKRTAIILVSAISLAIEALADDIKTTTGAEYRDAKLSRVEPDGIVITTTAGVIKIPFTELSKDLQERYHYDPSAAQKFAAETARQQAELYRMTQEQNARLAAVKSKQLEDQVQAADREKRIKQAGKALDSIAFRARVKPFVFESDKTLAHIYPCAHVKTGTHQEGLNFVDDYKWIWDRDIYHTGVIDEPMPREFESGDVTILTLYKIGHSNDSSRHPLYTTSVEKALNYLTSR